MERLKTSTLNTRAVVFACLVLACARGYSLLAEPHAIGDGHVGLIADAWRAGDAGRLEQALLDAGVQRVQVQRFDDQATVRLGPGPDGQPGQADGDDNFNGVTDDVSEMGAVGSDDVCLAPWATADWNSSEVAKLNNDQAVTIARGAFVTAAQWSRDDDDDVQELLNHTSPGMRLLILGRSGPSDWSRLIVE